MVKRRPGYTLVELMVVSAVLALLFSLGSTLLMRINTFLRLSVGKIETQRDVRNLLTMITSEIRLARSSQVALSCNDNAQPPYSKITFQKYQGDTISFWQSGRSLVMQKNGALNVLSKNIRSLMFSYPSTSDPSLLTVLLTIEKADGTGRTQALQLGGETIRILNE
ncbi:MAG: prepilin-type N-terminal cleavage/methylation domain-containing protein [Elusimicrobia bacterium]|nr:prepilin-type N-terminal cleavage/methylation domain-containing protein [Elusimicrobiota bacterium]